MNKGLQHNQQRVMALAMAEAKYAYLGAAAVITHADGIYKMMHLPTEILGIRGMEAYTRTKLQYPIIKTVNDDKRTEHNRRNPTGF